MSMKRFIHIIYVEWVKEARLFFFKQSLSNKSMTKYWLLECNKITNIICWTAGTEVMNFIIFPWLWDPISFAGFYQVVFETNLYKMLGKHTTTKEQIISTLFVTNYRMVSGWSQTRKKVCPSKGINTWSRRVHFSIKLRKKRVLWNSVYRNLSTYKDVRRSLYCLTKNRGIT